MTSSATSDEAADSGAARVSGLRLPRAARLRGARDIRRVLRRGRRLRGSLVDVFAAPSTAGRPRVTVIVPRHGHTIVERNRVRRRLLEVARTEWMPEMLTRRLEVDFILKAKPAAYEATYVGLRDSLISALEVLCAR